jgi:hypothetical protein
MFVLRLRSSVAQVVEAYLEVTLLPHIGPASASTRRSSGLLSTAFEGVEVTGRTGFSGGRLAGESTEVNEV